jgi:hypothetical protein
MLASEVFLVTWSVILLAIWVTPALGFALLVAWNLRRRGERPDSTDRQSPHSKDESALREIPRPGEAEVERLKERGRR